MPFPSITLLSVRSALLITFPVVPFIATNALSTEVEGPVTSPADPELVANVPKFPELSL